MQAQTAVRSFDLDTLSLNTGAQSLLLNTGEALTKGSLRVWLAGQYQHDPLVYFVSGQRVGAVVGTRVSAHLGAAYGLTDWLELGLEVPVVLTQSGDDLSAQGIAPVNGTVLGAPVIQAQFTLLRQTESMPLDLGLIAGLTFPIGSAAGLSKDPGPGIAFLPKVGVGHSFGSMLRLGAELGAQLRQSVTLSQYAQQTTDQIGSVIIPGIVASTLGQGLRGELSVRGLFPLTRTSAAAELMAGARYPLMNHTFEIFALAGPGFGRMPGIPSFRVFAGAAWSPRSFAAAAVEAEPIVQARPVEVAVAAEPPVAAPVPTPVPEPVVEAPKAEPAPVALEGSRISIKDRIHFASGKADILEDSFATLKQVAQVIKSHPELTRIEIRGFTDDHGLRARNVILSQARAEAVRTFLTNQGVDGRVLSAQGFGPDQPIASNATASGREQNRRVEFFSVP